MKCIPTHDQRSLHKTVTLCIFTLKSRVVHDTFSNWDDTSCVCVYKCIWVGKGDNAVSTLPNWIIYLICTGLHPHRALLLNLLWPRADLKMLSAHIYNHSHPCYNVYLITDKLSTTTLYLELQLNNIFDLHRVTPPQSFAFKLIVTQGRFEDAKCTHLQPLSPML